MNWDDLLEKSNMLTLLKLNSDKTAYKREVKIGDSGNTIDFVIEDKIVLEFKAKPFLVDADYSQIKRYLQVTGFDLGLLVNFREKTLKPRRVLNIRNRK